MNVKKAIKKIVAIGTGAALVGTTVLGAMAADLNEFPAPFVKDGMWDNIIVVGQEASTPDVIGAVDIATTLQYEMKQQLSGASGTSTTVSYVGGDSLELGDDNTPLQTQTNLGVVMDSELDTDDFSILSDSESFDDEDYEETLSLINNNADIIFEAPSDGDHEDEAGIYLLFEDGDLVYEYTVDFESPSSDVVSDSVEDFVDEELILFGESYTVTEATWANDGAFQMKMIGGSVSSEFVTTADPVTISYDGVEYEVSLERANEDGDDSDASFVINNYRTGAVDVGTSEEVDELGIKIFVKDVYEYDAPEPDVAEFYIGADEIVLTNGTALEIGDDEYSGVNVAFSVVEAGTDADNFKLDKLMINVTANADYYVGAGEKLGDFFGGDDYEDTDYIFGNIDFAFGGMKEQPMQAVTFDTNGDEGYTMTFETKEGNEYTLPIWYALDADTGAEKEASIGDKDGDLILSRVVFEPAMMNFATGATGVNISNITNMSAVKPIAKGDDIILLYHEDSDELKSNVNFVKFTSYSTSDDTLTFTDIGTDEEFEVELTQATGDTSFYYGKLDVEGNEFNVLWDDDNRSYAYIDDNLGVAASTVKIPLDSEALLSYSPDADTDIDFVITVTDDMTEDDSTTEALTITVKDDSENNDEADISLSKDSSFETAELNDDVDKSVSKYGVEIEYDTDAEEISVMIPYSQVFPSVALVSGEVSQQTVAGGSDSASYTINPAGLGVAQLDTEVSNWRTKNVIVVGGPCVNTVAAEIKGNNADCTAGFTDGSAVIELSGSSNVAMLVAGYSADDTRLAASVVHNFRSYPDKFEGMSLEVSGTSLSSVSITSVQ